MCCVQRCDTSGSQARRTAPSELLRDGKEPIKKKCMVQGPWPWYFGGPGRLASEGTMLGLAFIDLQMSPTPPMPLVILDSAGADSCLLESLAGCLERPARKKRNTQAVSLWCIYKFIKRNLKQLEVA